MAAPSPGQCLDGRYVLEHRLGSGGMGEIWRAADLNEGCEVAVKVLRRSLSRDPELVERFEREIELSSRLEHPHAVSVFGGRRSANGTLYLVMEVLAGRSLAAISAAEAPLAPLRVARIGRQIAGALHAAHAVGIIHRDLKPDNVIVRRDEQGHDCVKVFDFGLSLADRETRETRLTAVGLRLGTPAYMAPEYILEGDVDGRGDLYALGVVLYELASGSLPFDGVSYALMNKHVHEDPPPLASLQDVPDWLAAAVHALLQKDPDARPEDGAAVVGWLTPPAGTGAARR